MRIMDELIEAFLNGSEELPFFYDSEKNEVHMMKGKDNFIPIPQMSSPEAYRLMEEFTGRQEEEISKELLNALNGQKPFQSFKDKIKGQDIENDWYDFENVYAENKMNEWLKELDSV